MMLNMENLIPILIVILFIVLLIIPLRNTRVWIVIAVIVAIGSLFFSNISFVFQALLGNILALFGDVFGHYDGVITLAISSALALLSYWLISKLLSILFENRTVISYTPWFIVGMIGGVSAYHVRAQLIWYATRMAVAALPEQVRNQSVFLDPIFQNQNIFALRIDDLFFILTSISGGCAGIVISRYRSIKGYAIWGVLGLTLGALYQFLGLISGFFYPFSRQVPAIRQPDRTILFVSTLLAPTIGAILLLIVCKLIRKTKIDVVTEQNHQ